MCDDALMFVRVCVTSSCLSLCTDVKVCDCVVYSCFVIFCLFISFVLVCVIFKFVCLSTGVALCLIVYFVNSFFYCVGVCDFVLDVCV